MVFEFVGFSFDESNSALMSGKRRVKVERRALLILNYMLRHRDRVVTKEELTEVLWSGNRVSDSSLPRCMNALRTALSSRDRDAGGIIETVYGSGYRFVASVQTSVGLVDGGSQIGVLRAERRDRIALLKQELLDSQFAPPREATRRLELADLETKQGCFGDARVTILRAVGLGRTCNDGVLLGRAAIAMANTYSYIHHNRMLVDLLNEAIQALPPTESELSLELRVERELAVMGFGGPSTSSLVVERNIVESEKIDDVATRIRVLVLTHRALEGGDLSDLRRMLSDKAHDLIRGLEQPRLEIAVLFALLGDLAGVGDLERYESTCTRICTLATLVDENIWHARARLTEATLAYFRGQYTLSIGYCDQALAFIENSPEDREVARSGHGFMVGRELPERLLEAMPVLGIEAQRDPLSEICVELGALYLGLGDRAGKSSPGADKKWLDFIDRDPQWTLVAALCAELAFLRHDVPLAQKLVDKLSQLTDPLVAMGPHLCSEPLEYFRGLVETTLEAWDRADQHFACAEAQCQELNTPGFEARISYAWATMIFREGASARKPLALSKANSALKTAKKLNMTRLQREAQSLLEALRRSSRLANR